MKKELVDKNILSLPVMPMLPVKDPEGIVIKETDPFENAKFKFDYMKPMTFWNEIHSSGSLLLKVLDF
jgi:hypothetical protein